MRSGSLQIVIPVYNEGENIAETLGQIEEKIITPHSVFIVYDFDEDNTIPAVNEFIRKRDARNVRLVRNQYGRGASNAIRTGFNCAQNGVVLVVMADSSDDLSIVDGMYEEINRGYDIVCGSRYMKGGSQVGGPRFKKFLSRLAGMSLHVLVGVPTHDITNSFKMYRKSVLDGIQMESKEGFEIGMEVVVKAFLGGCRIAEIPSTWRDRVMGRSRFKLMKWLPAYTRWYVYALKGRFRRGIWHAD